MTTTIAIASGKGGVGKTTIAVNLSLALSKQNKNTLLLDADLGMANSHILLGINPKFSLEDFVLGNKSLDDVIKTTNDKLRFVSGGSAINHLLNLSDLERHKIIQNFGNVKNKPETMIIDVGAGAESSSLTFMASADKVIVVITAEPTSFIDAYGLIKTAFLDHKMENFGVIVNMAHSQIQAKLNFDKFRAITQKFLDVNLKFIGGVSSSQRIKNSIISRKPIMSGNPNKSPDVEAFLNMATNLNTLPTNKTGTIKFFEN